MDHVDEHFENLEKSQTDLRVFFEEYGYEIELEGVIDVRSKTIKYQILLKNGAYNRHIFQCSVTLMKDYSALDSIWEYYNISIASEGYEWIDSDRLEELIKYVR